MGKLVRSSESVDDGEDQGPAMTGTAGAPPEPTDEGLAEEVLVEEVLVEEISIDGMCGVY